MPGNSASGRAKREELAARAGRSPRAAGFCNSVVKAGSIGYEPEQHPMLMAGSNLASTGAVIALQSDGSTSTGGNGNGFQTDGSAYTLNRVDRQSVAIAANQRGEVRLDGTDGQTVGTIPATRSGKQLQGVLTPWDVQSKRVFSQDACCPTLSSGTREGANIQPIVLCMSTGQANAEILEDSAPTLNASHEQPICVADGNANAAADETAGQLQ